MKKQIILFSFIALIALPAWGSDERAGEYEKRADALHARIFSIDTHTDAPTGYCYPGKSRLAIGQVTAEKMREGGLDAAVYSIYYGGKQSCDSTRTEAMAYYDKTYELLMAYMEEHPEYEMARTADDLLRIKKDGRAAFLLGMENGYQLGTDISRIEKLYNGGLRVITFCHNYTQDICDSSTDTLKRWHGLSPFGIEVVAECNRLGIVVDLSHGATESLLDAIHYSKVPVICSHSAVWNIKQIPRNLRDPEIKALAESGGLIQITTGRWCQSNLPKEEVDIEILCDHIVYARSLAGIDHIGFGSDFDGGGGQVGFEDASFCKKLSIALMKRGWSDEDLEKFWGGNFLRVLKEVEEFSRSQGVSK